ncbi:FadR/GntR family transcriptional regulator [Rubrobacter marinus]|uniref:FadR/GntR family transcriptional regulator n=1 Tax=Rubrobacter marinus TaxID=2653852 RepID=UPI001408E4E7|nr:FadR/GntR family transcriptional regulator [Rubrobacter marinus]
MRGERRRGETRKRKTYERIAARIRASISSGELRQGDRLPKEADLAASLEVSRPTVREALKVLEAMRVLESSTGPTGGTFVRTLNGAGVAEHLSESIGLLLDVDALTLEELHASREAIEIPAAGMAALRRTPEDLAAIKETIERDGLKDSDSLVADVSFHRAVAAASGNRMLSVFMGSVHLTVRRLAERYEMPEVKQASQTQHQLIYEAIEAGDEDLAGSRMREHLRFAGEVYRQAIPRSDPDERSGKR